MKNFTKQLQIKLKPETGRLIKHFCVIFMLFYVAATLFFGLAGSGLDYQQGLIISEHLAQGLKSGFGLLCIGVLIIECI